MTVLTRRIFLQTAAASSVVLATDAIGRDVWLRSASEQVRLALVGIGPGTLDMLATLASIPAARVVALCDSRPERLVQVAYALRGMGHAHPQITTRIDRILGDLGVDALVVSGGFPSRDH